tara:strand:- start:1079 stop:1396 length:318 start_codon:yes stop_codon:yes gene_type:complete
MTTETQWLTVKQYMDIMPLSKPHVYRMIKENKIPHTRVGRKILIHHDAIHHIQSLRKKRINIMPGDIETLTTRIQLLIKSLQKQHDNNINELVEIMVELKDIKNQ